jgi:hypothetical protein
VYLLAEDLQLPEVLNMLQVCMAMWTTHC